MLFLLKVLFVTYYFMKRGHLFIVGGVVFHVCVLEAKGCTWSGTAIATNPPPVATVCSGTWNRAPRRYEVYVVMVRKRDPERLHRDDKVQGVG